MHSIDKEELLRPSQSADWCGSRQSTSLPNGSSYPRLSAEAPGLFFAAPRYACPGTPPGSGGKSKPSVEISTRSCQKVV